MLLELLVGFNCLQLSLSSDHSFLSKAGRLFLFLFLDRFSILLYFVSLACHLLLNISVMPPILAFALCYRCCLPSLFIRHIVILFPTNFLVLSKSTCFSFAFLLFSVLSLVSSIYLLPLFFVLSYVVFSNLVSFSAS